MQVVAPGTLANYSGEVLHLTAGCAVEATGKTLLSRNTIEIRCVPKLARLVGKRFHEMGMRVAKARHRDTGTKIEIASAVGRVEPRALAALKGKIGAVISRQNRRDHSFTSKNQMRRLSAAQWRALYKLLVRAVNERSLRVWFQCN